MPPATAAPRVVETLPVDAMLAEVADWLAAAAATPHPPPPESTVLTWPGGVEAIIRPGRDPALIDFGEVDPLEAVEFSFDARHARRVELVGDWSGWKPIPVVREGGRARAVVSLPDGEHAYAFRADDRQVPDPARPDVVGIGAEGPFSLVSLRRFERRLQVRNAGRWRLSVEVNSLPAWLSADPLRLNLEPKQKHDLRIRIDPTSVPAGFDQIVEIGAARTPDHELLPLKLHLKLARVSSAVAFVPDRVDADVNGSSVLLAVHGRAFGTGALAVRLRALGGLEEVARVRVELDEPAGPVASVWFPPFELPPLYGASAAELALDTGSSVLNRRFFRLTIPLDQGWQPG